MTRKKNERKVEMDSRPLAQLNSRISPVFSNNLEPIQAIAIVNAPTLIYHSPGHDHEGKSSQSLRNV